MKKRMLAILLLALLVVNISSCNSDSQSETKEPFENVGTTGAKFEGTDEKITESEVDHRRRHRIPVHPSGTGRGLL